MERDSSRKKRPKTTPISSCVWKLRRYGRFLPKGKANSNSLGGNCAWKIFESSESAGQLELSILGSGHLLVSQGQELLEGFSLLNAQSFLKIQHKSDSLLFNITVKGESRLVRLQFDGSSREEAIDFCGNAMRKLQDYIPIQENLNTPAPAASSDPAQPGTSTQALEDAPREDPAVAMGTLSIKHLSQFFLGECELPLPVAYHQCTLPSEDLEALLRLCLLDSGFPAFVEEVEKKLKELTRD